MRKALCLLAVLLVPLYGGKARAEGVVFAMNLDEVQITTRFDGSELLLFGAAEHGIPGEYDAIVTISGPPGEALVRRKDRIAGIWAFAESADFVWVPSFYTVASSGPLEAILDPVEDLRYGIRAETRIPPPAKLSDPESRPAFIEALYRLSADSGRVTLHEGAVEWAEGTLFRAHIALPVSLVPGDYAVRVFLLRDGLIVARSAVDLPVRKVTMQKALFTAAQDHGALYGVVSVLIAMLAGWLASVMFRKRH